MAKRRESIAQLDALLQSTFLDIFGDPCDNPKGWEERPPEKIVLEAKLGLVRSSKEYGWGYSVPYVWMDAVTKKTGFEPVTTAFGEHRYSAFLSGFNRPKSGKSDT